MKAEGIRMRRHSGTARLTTTKNHITNNEAKSIAQHIHEDEIITDHDLTCIVDLFRVYLVV